jgi:hypothetical protein
MIEKVGFHFTKRLRFQSINSPLTELLTTRTAKTAKQRSFP